VGGDALRGNAMDDPLALCSIVFKLAGVWRIVIANLPYRACAVGINDVIVAP